MTIAVQGVSQGINVIIVHRSMLARTTGIFTAPALKDSADLVTTGDHGAGVAELIDEIIHALTVAEEG